MTTAADLLEKAARLLAEAAELRLDLLDDSSLCATVAAAERAGRLIDSLRVLGAAEIDERSRYELRSDGLARRLGHVRGSHLTESITRASAAEVARRTRLGAQIRPRIAFDGTPLPAAFPQVATAMTSGTLGVDAAATITRCLTQAARHGASPDGIDAAEAALVDAAASQTADLIAVQARIWREALDPDGAEPRAEELHAARSFRLGREVNGMTPFSGAADPSSAALLRAAFAEHDAPRITPRFVDLSDCADEATELADPRTRDQRHFDIFIGLVTAGLRAPGEMRSTATVMAVITLDNLEKGAGVGWLDDVAEPVSSAVVRELACDGGIETITLDANGRVLNHGLKERFFTPAQRRALAVRDGGCVWVNCTAPPSWCHAHHVLEYSRGGPTDLDNGVLLCPAHHHMLHSSAFTMQMIDGTPRLLAPPWLDPEQLWRPLTKRRVGVAA